MWVFFPPEIHINGITWYRVFCIWLLSSVIMFLKHFFVVLRISTSFSSTAECYSMVWKYHDLFIDSLIDRNLSRFQFGAIISKSTMNIHIYMFVWTYIFTVNTLEWNSWKGKCIYITWLETAKLFSKVAAPSWTPTSNSSITTFWVTPHYGQHLVLSVFFILAIPLDLW